MTYTQKSEQFQVLLLGIYFNNLSSVINKDTRIECYTTPTLSCINFSSVVNQC